MKKLIVKCIVLCLAVFNIFQITSRNCANGDCPYTNIDCSECCRAGRTVSPECCAACNNCCMYNDEACAECKDYPT